MKIECPHCHREMDLDPNKVLGKYVVCSLCGQTFRWTKKEGSKKVDGSVPEVSPEPDFPQKSGSD